LFTDYGQENKPPLVQVPDQPDEACLIGVDCEHRSPSVHPLHCYLKWAGGIEGARIYLTLHLNSIGTNIVHVLRLLDPVKTIQ
jgi:hypothetical protein